MNGQQHLMSLPGMTLEEMNEISSMTLGLKEEQLLGFCAMYANKRKSPQDILLFTLLGFLGFAGINRFITGQIALGIIYFFTFGFCFVGTIIDLVNYQNIALEFNKKMILESLQMSSMSNFFQK